MASVAIGLIRAETTKLLAIERRRADPRLEDLPDPNRTPRRAGVVPPGVAPRVDGTVTCGADFEVSSVVTPASTLLQGINVGQLRRSGVVLYPREVVAVVHALCEQSVCVPTPDELWIQDDGQVLVRGPGGAAAAAPWLATMGVLIDGLLPPFSEERQYTPCRLLANATGTAPRHRRAADCE